MWELHRGPFSGAQGDDPRILVVKHVEKCLGVHNKCD